MPHSKKPYDFNFKVAFAGNAGVGKTALMIRFTKGTFTERLCTVGISHDTKLLSIDDNSCVQLEIWDTAGQERFRTITQSYYRNANGLILLYDITKYESLTGLREWIDDVKRYASPNILMILVGAKQDLAKDKREVTEEQAKNFAFSYPEIVDVVETSAKNSVNIETVFIRLAQAMKEQHETRHLADQPQTRSFSDYTINNRHKPSLFSNLCRVNGCCT
ncbi:ras-related protein RABD2a-like [Dendronephthya gigantea]|uniref:ras-related protein RABD2a-like n=1 Tax=Dendronephthya gigantea TaxID=151771 RepID=UPI00106AF5C3|nr:ras-related protein RABD2a-like [Dendronephthya gigantea]